MLMDWSAMTLGDLAARFDAVLIAEASRSDQLEPLLTAARGRVLRRFDWNQTDRLGEIVPRVVVVADLRDAGKFAETTLGRIDDHGRVTENPLVAIIDTDQLDMASMLFGSGAQILCEPEDRELVAALTIAGGLTALTHDSAGEGEAERLQRLNDEVARIAETLSRLTRREAVPPLANDLRTTFDAGPSAVTIDAAEIRRTIRSRRLRDRQFGQGLFEDPAWDMMLDLFAAELEHGQVSVSSLCVAAAVAPTTALRWIGKLTDAGIFCRQPDPFDRRRAFIELSPAASAGMRSHIAAVRAAGLPLA